MAERLTWPEIQEKYPDQWIGMTDVEYDDDYETNVKSAVVKETTSTYEGMGEMTEKMFNGELVMRYSTPNSLNCLPLGIVEFFG